MNKVLQQLMRESGVTGSVVVDTRRVPDDEGSDADRGLVLSPVAGALIGGSAESLAGLFAEEPAPSRPATKETHWLRVGDADIHRLGIALFRSGDDVHRFRIVLPAGHGASIKTAGLAHVESSIEGDHENIVVVLGENSGLALVWPHDVAATLFVSDNEHEYGTWFPSLEGPSWPALAEILERLRTFETPECPGAGEWAAETFPSGTPVTATIGAALLARMGANLGTLEITANQRRSVHGLSSQYLSDAEDSLEELHRLDEDAVTDEVVTAVVTDVATSCALADTLRALVELPDDSDSNAVQATIDAIGERVVTAWSGSLGPIDSRLLTYLYNASIEQFGYEAVLPWYLEIMEEHTPSPEE